MKYIHSPKTFFFINLLCLLWLPNFCDIKENEEINPTLQVHQTVASNPSAINNVPTKQEETSGNLNLEISKESIVQPSVEYVYSQPEEEIKNNADKKSSESFQSGSSTKNENQDLETLESRESISIKKKTIASVLTQSDPTIAAKDTDKSSETVQLSADEQKEIPLQSDDVTAPGPSKSDEASNTDSVPAASSPVVTQTAKKPSESSPPKEDNVPQQPQYDGMPSFDEWKKMMLAEQEKGGQKIPSPSPPGKKISSQKRRRNYSSYECGAKIVASNSEAEGTSRILNELVDEYMLNPCKAKIWFVIELCETVQASQIELANFELFSSCPKDFVVYSSDNFPTRDWVQLGSFTAAEQRILQSFELKQEGFGKFIKIELLSHYGKEHYCPLSVVRIFGTSMVDEYEEMETLDSHHEIPEDDSDRLDIPLEDAKATNLFGSATDAVINIVKKAAQALGQQQPIDESKNDTSADQQNISETKHCKLIDSAEETCEDASAGVESDASSLPKFIVPSSSVHHTMFRLLHRCDQCLSSKIRYYSSAQPQCRFFQAVLGPVVFQALCDWFKEHPLVAAHELPEQRDIPASIDSFVTSPTKSPPPQIMPVRTEKDSSLEIIINSTLGSINQSDKHTTVNATNVVEQVLNISTLSDKTRLDSSIQPVHTIFDEMPNDSSKPGNETFERSVLSVEIKSEVIGKPTAAIPTKTDSADKSTETVPTSSVTVNDFSSIAELTDSEQQQLNEFLSESTSASPDDMIMGDIISATEVPPGTKPPDDRLSEVRNELQGKVEPAIFSAGATAGQKESVFMRMSNRIKALEINMSLSSQYLQELSQRYRRQMEEMQRAFNRTIGTLNDTARKAAEKDFKQQEILNTLQLQVTNLSETVEFLLNERTSAFREMVETHVCLMVIEAIIMITIMSLCVRRISSARQVPPLEKEKIVLPPRISKRRNSADSCTPIACKVTKRSSSEEVLSAEGVLIVEPPTIFDPMLKAKKKNRKRSKGVHRTISNPSVPSKNSNPPSHCFEKTESHSDGCMLSNIKSKHASERTDHMCENCNVSCLVTKVIDKGRRLNGAPLQNLTNGSVISSRVANQQSGNGNLANGRRFSFKKFLKFQKRDSI
ncbi:SUN domain-containing ossification factor-like isoform X2 [Uloborus diversus]|uniref:SUN domain-containing ossification factor-like isoform X2 n=1 Tax=Uloborus diversus TaxID=327109 RepID=UPI002409CD96|nr:SUN domain-containing ossification factor-like isoform X2 [Uloborus diversus]